MKAYAFEIKKAEPTLGEIAIEEWRGIVGLEDDYEVSNMGRARSLKWKSPRIMSQVAGGDRNATFTAYKNGERINVNTGIEIYKSFVGPIPDGMHVARRDKNRFNNRLSNLFIESPELLSDRKSYSLKQADTMRVGKHEGKYRARFWIDGIQVQVGQFKTESEAESELNRWLECIAKGLSTIDDLPGEGWVEYDDKHDVSSCGRVRLVVHRDRMLFKLLNKAGQYTAGSIKSVAIAVWESFNGKCPEGYMPARKDTSRPPSIDNLKLIKRMMANCSHTHGAFDMDKILQCKMDGMTIREISEKFEISKTHLLRKLKQCGYESKYTKRATHSTTHSATI